MYHSRGFRGSRRSRGPRPVVQSYKKILLNANAGVAAGFEIIKLANGVDSVAAGQTSSTDTQVPTGSIIKFFECQYAVSNPTSTTVFMNCTLQYKLGGQSFVDPDLMGGSNQRNQCLHMDNYSVGVNQNSTHKFKFKIPKGFQRIRESMEWALVVHNTASVIRQNQTIFKFYR